MKLTPGDRSLSPTLLARVRSAWSSGRFRSVRTRRIVALVLVFAAVTSAVVSTRRPQAPPLIVAATDLTPGAVLTAEDLATRETPAEATPDHALTAYEAAIGQRLTGPVSRGEVITEERILTARLPESLTGARGARLVPVRPADESVAHLVRQGDVVDVIDAEQTVLARGAIVAVAPADSSGRASPGATPPVLLAMDEAAAQRVAAGGLDVALALILH